MKKSEVFLAVALGAVIAVLGCWNIHDAVQDFNADARLAEKVRVAQENVQSLYVMTPDELLQSRVNMALENVAAMERKS